MSTRSGDLDPGAVLYLLMEKGLNPSEVNELLNKKSGLLGVSGTSPDMEDLLGKCEKDGRAMEAVDLFCYQAKKAIGAFAAALSGLDTLVFTGGMGTNSPAIRERICGGMGFLGIRVDDGLNRVNSPVISGKDSPVTVRVIKTNEELMIARQTYDIMSVSP